MQSVISATTSRAYGAPARMSRRDSFLASAESLLVAAHEEFEDGRADLAMESAYRAALRIAGAAVADSEAVRKRKRLPTSAWEKLALTGERGKHWAARFRTYSHLRGRVVSGLELHPDAATVYRLIADAEEFYHEVHPGESPLAAA